MLSFWKMAQCICMLALLVPTIAACAVAPEQATPTPAAHPTAAPVADASTPIPTASPVANTSTPVPTAIPATPTAPEAAPTSTAQLDNAALTSQLYQQIKDGTPVVEIADPKIPLPDDVHPGQIKKYFQVGTISIGLVLRHSVNVILDVPATFEQSFTGLVISDSGVPWRTYLSIRDTDRITKNNPYYLWAQAGQLYVSIVDQNGAGSGEGNMRLMRLAATGDWELAGCYYFGGTYSGEQSDGDYFAFSQYVDKQRKQSAALCQTGDSLLLP